MMESHSLQFLAERRPPTGANDICGRAGGKAEVTGHYEPDNLQL